MGQSAALQAQVPGGLVHAGLGETEIQTRKQDARK